MKKTLLGVVGVTPGLSDGSYDLRYSRFTKDAVDVLDEQPLKRHVKHAFVRYDAMNGARVGMDDE